MAVTFGLLEVASEFDYKAIASALFTVANEEQIARVASSLGLEPIFGEDNEIIDWE